MLLLKRFCALSCFLMLLGVIFSPTLPNAQTEKTELVVVMTSVPPLSYRNSRGEAAGLSIDMLQLMAEREGWSLRFEHVDNPTIALEMLQSGEADIHPNLSPTDARKEVVDFTDVHTTLNMVAIVNSSRTSIRRVEDVDGLRFEYTEGSVVKRTAEAAPFFATPVESNYALIGRLIDGESDGIVQFEHVFRQYQSAGEYRLLALDPILRSVDAAFAVSRMSPVAVDAVNAAYQSIEPLPELERIRNHWLPPEQYWTDQRVRRAGEIGLVLLLLGIAAWFVMDSRRRTQAEAGRLKYELEKTAAAQQVRQQELMIQELNHRVRNIIALIRSVSRQARREESSLNSYANALQNRIKAIATAHDLGATKSVESHVSIKEIIKLELEPYQGAIIQGDDRWIKSVFSPIFALVVHELTTNAVKYGALSTPNGTVTVSLDADEHGFLIHWIEAGGPPVQVPQDRKGFGSTLIQNAIPHEFGGKVDIKFAETGVVAKIWLPDAVFGEEDAVVAPGQALDVQDSPADLPPDTVMEALVVEDNFIIAADFKSSLEELGCEPVHIASNVRDALTLIDAKSIDIAFLDMNLGIENSFPIARRLQELKIPFYFASGYGEASILSADLKRATIIPKPVEREDLAKALRETMERRQSPPKATSV